MFRPSARTTYSSARSSSRTHERPSPASTRNGSSASPSASNPKLNQRDLSTLDNARSQQARRAEYQHRDQHEEREHVLVVAAEEAAGQVADVARAERLDQSQQEPPQHRAAEIADSAQHRSREGLETEQEAHVIVRQTIVSANHHAGDRSQRGADR